MATFTSTVSFYDSWYEAIGKDVNLATDTFKCGLVTSTYTPSASTHNEYSDITNEVSGSGYAQVTLASVTFSQTGGIATFNFTDPVFTASGGSIVARRFFIYDDTTTTKYLVCYGLIDNTNADVTTTDGNTLTIVINASGLFQVKAP